MTTNGDNGIDPLGATTTPWAVDYGRITPLIVKAVQDIANLSATFKANLIAWLASAKNGIHDLYASIIHSERVETTELCMKDANGETCLTRSQVDAALSAAAAGAPVGSGASSGSSVPVVEPDTNTGTSTTTSQAQAPQLEVNGANPATISVGATYADLGATITGPTADLNLGLTTLLDGATTTSIQLDTTSPGQHTIEYRAFDQSGLMGSATRTINVVSATSTPPTSAPDVSSTTDATSTAQ